MIYTDTENAVTNEVRILLTHLVRHISNELKKEGSHNKSAYYG